MKLYHFQHSPNSRRVRMLLAEKQVEVDLHNVDIMQGEQFSDDFKALSPRCTIPVLVTDDGTVIGETLAIMHTIEDLHRDPPMFGADPIQRGVVMMWEHRAEIDGFCSAEDLVRNSMPMLAGRAKPGPNATAQIPALAERGRERLLSFYREVDGELAQREFLAGESFSVADITLLSVIDLAAALGGLPLPEDLEHLGRWYAAVSSRPSASA